MLNSRPCTKLYRRTVNYGGFVRPLQCEKRVRPASKMACPTMIQVTNISPRATTQHMRELFSYLGDVTEVKVYPEEYVSLLKVLIRVPRSYT